jgi:hypothetical protein
MLNIRRRMWGGGDKPMKPIFTMHAGEYLFGSYLEKKFKQFNIWIPSKDTGVDLLVTDSKNRKTISLQVKFSKDFLVTDTEKTLQIGLKSIGWWALKRDKVKQSSADFWVFVMYSFEHKRMEFVIIPLKVLLERITRLHGNIRVIQSYLWVTARNKCWETRGLSKREQILIANHSYHNKHRDFTEYLNNLDLIKKRLK